MKGHAVLLSLALAASAVHAASSLEVLYELPTVPCEIHSPLIKMSDGTLVGSSRGGGRERKGTVFQVTDDGRTTILVHFTTRNGSEPSGLIRAKNGALLGTTREGGELADGTAGLGTVFAIEDGVFRTLHTFDGSAGKHPTAGLVDGSDGALYGVTSEGGAHDSGTVFKLTYSGQLTVLGHLGGNAGRWPLTALVEGSSGTLYGTCWQGGAKSCGTVFKVRRDGVGGVVPVFTFERGVTGDGPRAFTRGSDGAFYGATSNSTAPDAGKLFRITEAGAYSLVKQFSYNSPEGYGAGYYSSTLAPMPDGFIYGTTLGSWFRISPSGEYSVFLQNPNPPGVGKLGTPLVTNDGTIYGTRWGEGEDGGQNYGASIFRLDPTGFTSLGVYWNTEGYAFRGGVVRLADGTLYGNSEGGGVRNGFLHRLENSGDHKVLATLPFTGKPAYSRILPRPDGTLLFIANYFGQYGDGVVMQADENGRVGSIATLNGAMAGGNPPDGLYDGGDGWFYGVGDGGVHGKGAIFRVNSAGALEALAQFDGANGTYPQSIMRASDGNFYGITSSGGDHGDGTVFKLTPSFALTAIYHFEGLGVRPYGRLVEDGDGVLYGTTMGSWISRAGQGRVFRITRDGQYSLIADVPFDPNPSLYQFGGGPVGLILGGDGYLYGTTLSGGKYGKGSVFRVNRANGELKTVVDLDGDNGFLNYAPPIWGSDGNLYGATAWSVWKLTPNKVPVAAEDSVHLRNATAVLDVLQNDVDPDGEALTVVAVSNGETGTASVTPEGAIKYTAGSSFEGSDRFTYTISDGYDTATGTVLVQNDAPTANDDIGYTARRPERIWIPVTTNDSDPNGHLLRAINVDAPRFGKAAIDSNGISYTPGPSFASMGKDEFNYTISDQFGGTASAKVRVYQLLSGAQGRYTGTLERGEQVVGSGRIKLSKSGAFTAVLFLDGRRIRFHGKFDADGMITKTFTRRGRAPVTIELRLNNPDTPRSITVSLSDSVGLATGALSR